jgi:hypothetical protein
MKEKKINQTVIPKLFKSSIEKNQMQVESMNAKNAVNAIKFEIMPPIGPTMFDAPIEMASKILFASL